MNRTHSVSVTPQEKNRCPEPNEHQRGRDHAASVEAPDRNRLYWEHYRHSEADSEFAAGYCDFFRNI